MVIMVVATFHCIDTRTLPVFNDIWPEVLFFSLVATSKYINTIYLTMLTTKLHSGRNGFRMDPP